MLIYRKNETLKDAKWNAWPKKPSREKVRWYIRFRGGMVMGRMVSRVRGRGSRGFRTRIRLGKGRLGVEVGMVRIYRDNRMCKSSRDRRDRRYRAHQDQDNNKISLLDLPI